MATKASKIHLRHVKTRGFVEVPHPERKDDVDSNIWLRKGYKFEKCYGESHTHAYGEGCGICLHGLWGWMVVKSV